MPHRHASTSSSATSSPTKARPIKPCPRSSASPTKRSPRKAHTALPLSRSPNLSSSPTKRGHLTPTSPTFTLPMAIPIPPPALKRNNSAPDPEAVVLPPSLSIDSTTFDAFHDMDNILHTHLCIHLGRLYPNTPDDTIVFIATRLLSRDCPHGHDGEWVPLRFEDGPALAEGHVDHRIHHMYAIAHRSYLLLINECPDDEHKL